jgi:rare lipoprotein A
MKRILQAFGFFLIVVALLSFLNPENLYAKSQPQKQKVHQSEKYKKVLASWYGKGHHGKLMSSGVKFDMHKNTLAHKTMKMGTEILLLNPKTGQYSIGIVTDRGPYIPGREVDLSYNMAKELGIIKKGIARLYMFIGRKNIEWFLEEPCYNF